MYEYEYIKLPLRKKWGLKKKTVLYGMSVKPLLLNSLAKGGVLFNV